MGKDPELTSSAAAKRLREFASSERAIMSARYFKTDPGQYGAGDIFIGVRVPDTRKVAREFRAMPLTEIDLLLHSSVHEERLLALLILVGSLVKSTPAHQLAVFDFYLARTQQVNNWDLVDSSAPAIVGGYLHDKPLKDRRILDKLARSQWLWDKRIAIVATQQLIREGQFDDTLRIGELLLKDPHDLIHKAVGWMLREVGAKHEPALAAFLTIHSASMPRTMLRYAIEHYDEPERRRWMSKEKVDKNS